MMSKPRANWKARLWWGAAVCYALVLGNFLFTPHPWWFLGKTGESIDQVLTKDVDDFFQHAGVFLPLGGVVVIAQRMSGSPSTTVCFGGTVAYAIAGEVIQYFVPNRYADPTDALANGLGAVIGWSLGWALLLWLEPDPKK